MSNTLNNIYRCEHHGFDDIVLSPAYTESSYGLNVVKSYGTKAKHWCCQSCGKQFLKLENEENEVKVLVLEKFQFDLSNFIPLHKRKKYRSWIRLYNHYQKR